jgi:hypothetical protein
VVTPEVGAVVDVAPAGLPIGLTVGATVGLGPALAAAAAKAMPVGLWQLMQSWLAVLPWCWPTVAVLMPVTFCQVAPCGPWQLLHAGVDDLPAVYVMNGALVCGTVAPANPPGTVVEVWQVLQVCAANGRCWVAPGGPFSEPPGCSGWPPACPCAVP